ARATRRPTTSFAGWRWPGGSASKRRQHGSSRKGRTCGMRTMTDAVAADAHVPKGALARLMRRRLALVGIVLIVIVVASAVFAPLLAPYAPDEQHFDGLTLEGAPLPPNEKFALGTDLLGRDLLSRILYGARTSL